jgi:tRNA-(ms[2]io[6]A)-hydroxylase
MVRHGGFNEVIDRLFVSALIEARSCERFALLADASTADPELQNFYTGLFTSELGHYSVFINLARKIGEANPVAVEARWQEMLAGEAKLLQEQAPGPRIHSWI